MSPIPRHVTWANREPHHRGAFGFNYTTASGKWRDPDTGSIENGDIEIPASGSVDIDFPAGNVSMIYRAKVESSQGEDFAISFFEKGNRNASDFIVNFSNKMTLENGYYIFQGKDLIVCVDKDGSEYIHATLTGVPFDVLTVELDMVRFS